MLFHRHVVPVAAAVLLAGCVTAAGGAPTGEVAHLATGQQTAAGQFVGASDHVTTGEAAVFWTGEEWVVSLASDFSLDGAPDPVIGLGRDGVYDPASQSGPLASLTGAQTYALPAGIDVADYDQVYVWCEEFAVPLGVADLTLQ